MAAAMKSNLERLAADEIDAQLGIIRYIERILAMPDCYVRDLWTSALAKARERMAELENRSC